MKKLIQTKFYRPEKGERGNCMMTTYACYFDIEIDQVPNIEDLFDSKPEGFWYQCFSMWLRDYMYHEEMNHQSDPYKEGFRDYYFAIGPSSRGCQHQVIYKDGKLFHDPHPSGDGLLSLDYYLTLKKI